MTEDQPTVFVIDDDASVRDAIKGVVRSVGLRAETFASPQDFLRKWPPDGPSCLVLDVRLPGLSGLDFQHQLTGANIQIPIIFLTGYGDIPMSVQISGRFVASGKLRRNRFFSIHKRWADFEVLNFQALQGVPKTIRRPFRPGSFAPLNVPQRYDARLQKRYVRSYITSGEPRSRPALRPSARRNWPRDGPEFGLRKQPRSLKNL